MEFQKPPLGAKSHRPNRKLSQAIDSNSFIDGDSLNLNSKDISEINQVDPKFFQILKLNLAHNGLCSLKGIEQFKSLEYLMLSHNNIIELRELERVRNKKNLVVLALDGNICGLHPDLTAFCVETFPRLVELNGNRITDHTRQDLADASVLTRKIMPYFYTNEQKLLKLDGDLKKLKIKIDLLSHLSMKRVINAVTGPYWEDVNAVHSKIIKGLQCTPNLPIYSHKQTIRPFMILNYIEVCEQTLHDEQYEIDFTEKDRLYKWLFCEVLLQMHSEGNHSLQTYLEFQTGKQRESASLHEHFMSELKEFMSLAPETENRMIRGKGDIYPSFLFEAEAKWRVRDTVKSDMDVFPVFGGNSNYLKALLFILESQVKTLLDLNEEYRGLLRLDLEGILPSLSMERQISPDLRSNKREFSPFTRDGIYTSTEISIDTALRQKFEGEVAEPMGTEGLPEGLHTFSGGETRRNYKEKVAQQSEILRKKTLMRRAINGLKKLRSRSIKRELKLKELLLREKTEKKTLGSIVKSWKQVITLEGDDRAGDHWKKRLLKKSFRIMLYFSLKSLSDRVRKAKTHYNHLLKSKCFLSWEKSKTQRTIKRQVGDKHYIKHSGNKCKTATKKRSRDLSSGGQGKSNLLLNGTSKPTTQLSTSVRVQKQELKDVLTGLSNKINSSEKFIDKIWKQLKSDDRPPTKIKCLHCGKLQCFKCAKDNAKTRTKNYYWAKYTPTKAKK